MHVIICAEYGGPYPGSFVPMLAATAREARRRGYPTTVLLPGGARQRPWITQLEAVAEVRFGSDGSSRGLKLRSDLGAFTAALGAHAGPAVIHTHFDTSDIPAALMRLRRPGTAVFWHCHNPIRDGRLWRLRTSLRFACFGQLVNGILCVSQELRDDLRARAAPRRKLRVFPNAIDTRTFAPVSDAERSAARRSLGLPDDARVVLHYGWSWYRKGGDLMLGAAELLVDEPDLVILTVVSEDDPASGSLAGAPNVRMHPPTADVKGLLAAADVFLSCSRAEGALPLAVLEALACDLPVVVTDIPVQARLVAGLPAAAAVPVDPLGIATGIRRMLAVSEDDRSRHRALVKEMFETSFSLDAWSRRLLDLYEDALGAE
jgi:glycosyltransferase involved in cell wall biosynthesis